jgi:hypothetical protein
MPRLRDAFDKGVMVRDGSGRGAVPPGVDLRGNCRDAFAAEHAKVMEGKPIAVRMKELEALERVAERIDRISAYGGLGQVLDGLVKLR